MIKSLIIVLIVLLVNLSPFSAKKSRVITLDEESWKDMLSNEWMVKFYADWCPSCKQLEPQWDTFSSWSDDLNLKIGAVDVTANPGLSGRFLITALPTIYHVKNGVFRQYKGPRDSNSFVNFIEEKQWEKLDPVSGWKNPNSYQMSIVSYFFKISMALRAVHSRLVEDYGIPYWGSYIIFAFATILLGAFLGLMIVCLIDVVFPAKPITLTEPKEMKSDKDNSDIAEDEEDDKENTDREDTELRQRKPLTEFQEN